MTNPDSVSIAATTLISIAGIWILLFWCVRAYRVDALRASIFALRGELFDLAARGDIAFDHPAYGQLRTTMNGFLRLAERIDLMSTVLTNKAIAKAPPNTEPHLYEARWKESLDTLSPGTAMELNALRARMHFEIAKNILFNSPIFIVTFIPGLFLVVVHLAGKHLVTSISHRCYRWVERVFERLLNPLDGTALSIGG